MWRMFRQYLFLNSPSFDASGRLFFVIAAFAGYLHSYVFILILLSILMKANQTESVIFCFMLNLFNVL